MVSRCQDPPQSLPARPAFVGDDDDDGGDDDEHDNDDDEDENEDRCSELWLVVGSPPSMHSINPHLPARHSQSITLYSYDDDHDGGGDHDRGGGDDDGGGNHKGGNDFCQGRVYQLD